MKHIFDTLEGCITYSIKDGLKDIIDELENSTLEGYDLEDSSLEFCEGWLDGVLSLIDIFPENIILSEELENIILKASRVQGNSIYTNKNKYILEAKELLKEVAKHEEEITK